MYAYINGIIKEKMNNIVVVDVNGVGYEIFASNNTLDSLPPANEVATVYTYLHVREDEMSLYGFESPGKFAIQLLVTIILKPTPPHSTVMLS